jgi:DNA-directed RNA polymerase specialized sigma24 family protein
MSDRQSVYARYPRRDETAKEIAKRMGTSTRTAQRWTSRSRDEWLQQKADEREEIRAFHDDQGHSWAETARHFRLSLDTVKQRAYRARKERDEPSLETPCSST